MWRCLSADNCAASGCRGADVAAASVITAPSYGPATYGQVKRCARSIVGVRDGQLTSAASELAERLMGANSSRLHHMAGVAARAVSVSVTVAPTSVDTLVAAAWLHDIGYAPDLVDTGFHQLDGARYLRREGWPDTVCNLVAH